MPGSLVSQSMFSMAVSYTHLDVYKRQISLGLTSAIEPADIGIPSITYKGLLSAVKERLPPVEVEKSARADLKPKLSGAANFQYTGNPLELSLDVPSLRY